MPGSYRIGTSGWNYKHWRELFYPKGLAQKNWFAHYAGHFDTVELNVTFYRLPTASMVEKWALNSPDQFQFAVKLWRGITHYRKLHESADLLERYFEVMDILPPAKRGPLLVQLPPSLHENLSLLQDFLHEITRFVHRKWRLAVEFRHDSWLNEDVRRLLAQHDVAVCLHDMHGRGATETENDSSLVYIRRHGSGGGRYSGSYSPEQIANDAARIRDWTRAGKDVYVYFNNDIGGHAIENARQLLAALNG